MSTISVCEIDGWVNTGEIIFGLIFLFSQSFPPHKNSREPFLWHGAPGPAEWESMMNRAVYCPILCNEKPWLLESPRCFLRRSHCSEGSQAAETQRSVWPRGEGHTGSLASCLGHRALRLDCVLVSLQFWGWKGDIPSCQEKKKSTIISMWILAKGTFW